VLENGVIQISVSDTGIGIKEEDKSKLFKAFSKLDVAQTMHMNKTGVGLGLSIANSLAQILGTPNNSGIKVDSSYGQGSTFTFAIEEKLGNGSATSKSSETKKRQKRRMLNIPASKSQKEMPKEMSESSESNADVPSGEGMITTEIKIPEFTPPRRNIKSLNLASTAHSCYRKSFSTPVKTVEQPEAFILQNQCKCPKILIVDDDCFNIMALERMLKFLDLKCDCVYEGADAIKKVLERQNNPCSPFCEEYKIIFMDCSMPIMDGFETTVALRSHKEIQRIKDIKIIGCTAYTSDGKVNECIAAGMNDVLFKPMSRVKLQEIIKKHLKSGII